MESFLSETNFHTVEYSWQDLTEKFQELRDLRKKKMMNRTEISFHNDIKLLGYLTIDTNNIEGDILEIGIWKGKSLALMRRLAGKEKKVIGIDPLKFYNQEKELNYYRKRLFKNTNIIRLYSDESLIQFRKISEKLALLHIDGSHFKRDVILDFLLFSPFVVTGGYVVFDDYNDTTFSPEVRPAVDFITDNILEDNYQILGQIPQFPNPFVLKKL